MNDLEALEDDFEPTLRRYAPMLNARSWRWPVLGPTYHILADALCWLGEAPTWSQLRRAENALRPLWYYRTSLIIGEAREEGEVCELGKSLWELGKSLFPCWVGFHPSRCEPLRKYKIRFRAGRMASARCVADLKRQIEEEEQ